METIKCLDKGYITLIDTFGDELTIVNAARVSFGAEKKALSEGDVRLMRYLYREKHMSPFRHLMFRFKIKAPEFVMRQLYKHVVGIEATADSAFQLHGWNELSGRYKPINEFYTDFAWRYQSADNKQASAGDLPPRESEQWTSTLTDHMGQVITLYHAMLEAGIAKEQARMILPLNMYSEVIWTASAQAVLNLIELRDHDHAQQEIRVYAQAMRDMLTKRFPTLAAIWFDKGEPTVAKRIFAPSPPCLPAFLKAAFGRFLVGVEPASNCKIPDYFFYHLSPEADDNAILAAVTAHAASLDPMTKSFIRSTLATTELAYTVRTDKGEYHPDPASPLHSLAKRLLESDAL